MPAKKRKETEEDFNSYVVALGASAGGLEAINEFFDNTPSKTGFAYVLVQHLSPDYKSLMPELLAKHTSMKVYEAEDGMALKPNSIYLIPSKKVLTLKEGRLALNEKIKNNQPNNAIDVFFISLAESYGSKAVGVVLSGTGTDGTKGLEAIKRLGGIVAVQDPLTAAFDGMPNSAISAGVADLILPPENISTELGEYLKESSALKLYQLNSYRDEFVLKDILMLIRRETGHDFSYYKRPTLFRRLSKRLLELNISKLREYLDYLNTHPEEIKLISQDFLINVTYFFRDKAAFDIIKQNVIPKIMKEKGEGGTVKIWSLACSSGEEAYSLAMLLHDYAERKKITEVGIKIFATDIDREALDKASRGIYPEAAVKDIPDKMLARYFTKERDMYRVNPELRKMIVFSFHDILKDPPFSRMDLITCRNMLIYIGTEAQKEILRKIHFALNVDGYLFLGPSEHLGQGMSAMAEVDKKWRIFQNLSKPMAFDRDQVFSPLDRGIIPMSVKSKAKNPLLHVADLFRDTLAEQQKIAGIFIDPNLEVRQATGNYKAFIDLPDTGFNFNIMKLVPADLGIALNIAIRKAMKDQEPVTMKKIKVKKGREVMTLNLIVKPYLRQNEYGQQFLFIVLSEEPKKEGTPLKGIDVSKIDRVEELEQELTETKENLQAVIEEVEAANEELQSTNEEMVSTNEELQSTNEELQSLNEELHTVSAEHQARIRELVELNDDMNNFFRNSNIGQILVDRNLIIRKFSPSVTQMVNLIESDVNRSIRDISTKFKNLDFVDEINKVIKTEKSLEREIMLAGQHFLLRITPYIRQDQTIDGVVVSFINISETKKLNSLLSAVLDSSPSSICAKKAVRDRKGKIVDFEYVAANASFAQALGMEPGELTGRCMKEFHPDNDQEEQYREVVETGVSKHYEYYNEEDNKWYDVVLVKLMDGLVSISTDITDKKRASELIAKGYEDLKATSSQLRSTNVKLEQSNMDLMQFASVASHDLKEPLRKIQTFGNLLMSKVQAKLGPAEQNQLAKMVSSSGRMQRLIEDVLTLSKLSNQELKFQETDLSEVLGLIKDDLEITIREKQADIIVKKLPKITAVTGQIHQIFQNLISNSLKFTNSKKPEIVISQKTLDKKAQENLKIVRPENYVCISVKDNGIGFDDVYKEKIFGIFQRLNGSNYDGTGIGLAICKKIVENHGGYITADSKPHRGAEFLIILPKK